MKIFPLVLAIFVGCLICSSVAATMIYFSWDDVSRFLGLSKKEASPAPVFSPPSNTCVPYTKETQCKIADIGCLSYTEEAKSAGWYMMAETGKCEEKMYGGCSRPTCAPATNFKTRAECETACVI